MCVLLYRIAIHCSRNKTWGQWHQFVVKSSELWSRPNHRYHLHPEMLNKRETAVFETMNESIVNKYLNNFVNILWEFEFLFLCGKFLINKSPKCLYFSSKIKLKSTINSDFKFWMFVTPKPLPRVGVHGVWTGWLHWNHTSPLTTN